MRYGVIQPGALSRLPELSQRELIKRALRYMQARYGRVDG